MGRTKKTACMSTGGKAPRRQFAKHARRVRHPDTKHSDHVKRSTTGRQKPEEAHNVPKCTICHHHPAYFIAMCGHRICCNECHSTSYCRRQIYNLEKCPLCRQWIGLNSGEMLYHLKH